MTEFKTDRKGYTDLYNDMEPKILFVMGDGRSGSTLLGIILGNHPSIECVGELRRWLEFNGYPRSAAEKPGSLAFWEAVKIKYFAEKNLATIPALLQAQLYVESYTRFPLIMLRIIPSEIKQAYETHLNDIFNAVGIVSQKPVILDISKNMGRALALLRIMPGHVKVIHLVRDPRGVLWSQLKQNIEQDYKSPLKSMIHYFIKNSLSHLVRWVAPKGAVLQVRYEDLVNHPLEELRRIGFFIDLPLDDLAKWAAGGNPLMVGNLIDGNRIRNEDTIRLKTDREWQSKLSMKYRFLAILMTLPFFLLYGYHRTEQLNNKEIGI